MLDLGNPKPVFYRNRRKAEWPLYADLLKRKLQDSNITEILTANELENRVNLVTSVMVDCFREACPQKQVRKKGPTHRWWTPTLTELRLVARRAHHAAYVEGSNHSETELELYRVAIREYKYSLRVAKRTSFRDFCDEVKALLTAARLYRALSAGRTIKLGSVELPDGSYTAEADATLKHLLEIHFPNDPNQVETEVHDDTFTEWPSLQEIVNERQVYQVLGTFRRLKAAGPDEIFPEMLLKCVSGCHQYSQKLWRLV